MNSFLLEIYLAEVVIHQIRTFPPPPLVKLLSRALPLVDCMTVSCAWSHTDPNQLSLVSLSPLAQSQLPFATIPSIYLQGLFIVILPLGVNSLRAKSIPSGTKNSRSEGYSLAKHTAHKHPHHDEAVCPSRGMALLAEHAPPPSPTPGASLEGVDQGRHKRVLTKGENNVFLLPLCQWKQSLTCHQQW